MGTPWPPGSRPPGSPSRPPASARTRSGKTACAPVRLDAAAARVAARDYLTRTGHAGTVTVDASTVTVAVATTRPTAVLRIVGVDSLTVTGTASARSIAGVVHEEPGT